MFIDVKIIYWSLTFQYVVAPKGAVFCFLQFYCRGNCSAMSSSNCSNARSFPKFRNQVNSSKKKSMTNSISLANEDEVSADALADCWPTRWPTCFPKWELGSNNTCPNRNWALITLVVTKNKIAVKSTFRSSNPSESFQSKTFQFSLGKVCQALEKFHKAQRSHQHATDAPPTHLVPYKFKEWPTRRPTVGRFFTFTSQWAIDLTVKLKM